MLNYKYTWIFQGERATFPVAVFTNKEKAISWISQNQVSGILTKYPLDVSVYDWAINNGFFNPKTDFKKTPEFKQKFTTAYIEHLHFKNGREIE